MDWKKSLVFLGLILATLAMTAVVGCDGSGSGSDSDDDPVEVVSVTEYPEMDLDGMLGEMELAGGEELTLSTCLGGYGSIAAAPDPEEVHSLMDYIKLIWELLHDIGIQIQYKVVWPSQVVYKWKDGGHKESGLLVKPVFCFTRIPMLVLLHPTQTERKYSPSYNNLGDNELTTQMAYLLSMCGYIVAVPDYPGLGVNHDVHPYCLDTLGRSAVGMIYATGKEASGLWNGRIFLMGYSEGGYATVVTAKEIEANHKKLKLIGAAALEGPQSLSRAMHKVILESGPEYDTPYFLPYVIAGYGQQYPNVADLQFPNAVIDEPPGLRDKLLNMMNGDYAGGQISDVMRTVTPYEGARSILSQKTLEALHQSDSEVNQKFVENDSFYNWKPTIKLLLAHNPKDETVPSENSQYAKDAWADLSNVELLYFKDYLDDQGTVHAGALPFAYFRGMERLWVWRILGAE